MTVSSETNRSGPYLGNGVATSFPYGFRIVDADHIRVVRTIAGVDADVPSSEYSVTGVGSSGGGSVVFAVAPPTGVTLNILIDIPFVQETDLVNQGAYYAETVEDALDLAAMRDLQLKEELGRALILPVNTDPASIDAVITSAITLADAVDELVTVAGIASEVEDVAAIDSQVVTVAGIAPDVTTVAGIAGAVSDVAAIDTQVGQVAANVTDIRNYADRELGPKAVAPTTRNDGTALQVDDRYFDTTTVRYRVYTGTIWIDAGSGSLDVVPNTFTGNGAQTAFSLSAVPGVAQNVIVWVGGSRQIPGVAYTVSGTTLTFTVAPPNGVAVTALILFASQTINIPATGSVGTGQLADGALAANASGRGKMANGFLTQEKLGGNISNVLSGFRNKIINGDFDIWQRQTAQTSIGYGSDDRWNNGHFNSPKNHSRQAFTPGQTDVPGNPRFFSRTVVTSVANAANFVNKAQLIEGVNTLAGKRATLTFYAKADATKNIAIDFAQLFGTGGSPSSAVLGIGARKVALTTAWQKFSLLFDVPSIAGKTLGVNGDDALALTFWFEAGANFNSRTDSLGQQSGTFDLAHVSLVEGDATAEDDPFAARHPQQELALCQRYYVLGRGTPGLNTNGATANVSSSVIFPVPMRTTPTFSWTGMVVGFQNRFNATGFSNTAGSSWNGGDNNYTADAEL